MKPKTFLIGEFVLLFIIFPTSLILDYPLWVKGSLGIFGFIYILYLLQYKLNIEFKIKHPISWKPFWKRIVVTFLVIVLVTTLFIWFTDKSVLFYVPKNHPILLCTIIPIYTLLSAWPQELLYRTFFYKRYAQIFRSKTMFVFVNATVFMLAHLFFKNYMVLLITFVGGIIFSLTYLKFKSTALVTFEHALYGNWIYAVGMGQMLGFPGFDT